MKDGDGRGQSTQHSYPGREPPVLVRGLPPHFHINPAAKPRNNGAAKGRFFRGILDTRGVRQLGLGVTAPSFGGWGFTSCETPGFHRILHEKPQTRSAPPKGST